MLIRKAPSPMPPLWSRSFNTRLTSSEISQQLRNPGDIFSVLLILGGDVVCRAIAQMAGAGITPVSFSFGWVAYIVTALLTAIGERRLMPYPDSPCLVINARSEYVRENRSWILGRIMRDFEVWMDEGRSDGPIRRRLNQMLDQRWEKARWDADQAQPGSSASVPRSTKAGLCVSIFHTEQAQPGYHGYDLLYYMGIATAAVQFGIAAIPLGIWGDWGVFLVTAAGIVLSFTTASLPQWAQEKWACRRNSQKTVILTRGNGSQHAIVIVGSGKGLDLEDLASGPIDMDVSRGSWTSLFLMILAVLWIVLLIIAAGLQQNTWFLLATGGLGIIENILVAGWPRRPKAFGVPLTFKEVIGEPRVMETLFAVEEAYPRVGLAMLDTFFPGRLSHKEKERWNELRQLADALDESQQQSTKPSVAHTSTS
ncbi:hypothetical protein BDW74DRAFT_54664 [Aspergillus multicolor]|uniref:uncharacterized protein n=1 Tax=Aspergillus multicolor TaxID=41759 RepID=UPI003CCCDEFA